MRLLRIHAENFMALGSCSIDLDRRGLVLLSGENQDDPANDSNGSGKTTILEALTWGLFGEGLPRPQGNATQGVRADEVLSSMVGKQCRVVVDLADEDVHYRVERWRKYKFEGQRRDSGCRLWVNGVIREALDANETERLIQQQLGIDREIWCRGVLFGQESAFNFCEATAAQRQAILTTVMGLSEIDTWIDRCRDEKRALTNRMAESGGRLTVLRQQIERALGEDPSAQAQAFEAQRAQTAAQLQRKEAEITEAGKQARARLEALPEPLPLVASSPPTGARQPLAAAWSAAAAAVAEAKQRYQRAQEDSARAASAVVAAQRKQGRCPTCGQTISEAHQRACMTEAERLAASAQSEMARAAAAISPASDQFAVHDRALKEFDERERQANAAAFAAQQAYHSARTARVDAQQRVDQLIAEYRRVSSERQRVEREANPWWAVVEHHKQRVLALQQQAAEAEADQRGIGEALDMCQWWDRELPRFKTWLFDSIVDTLASEANRWLRVMSGGVLWLQISTQRLVGKRVRDEIDVQVYRWNPDGSVTTRPYRIWSGGEKRRIALAVDLGLSRLLADRASRAYRFLGLDEVDRHLDAQGCQGLRAVLDELRQDKETCLVITHDPEFKASFDHHLRVVKRGGVAQVVDDDQREQAPREAVAASQGEGAVPESGAVVSDGGDVRRGAGRHAGRRRARGAGRVPSAG
jgi:DNA repair exonuclease SbcCD ATPase subunit